MIQIKSLRTTPEVILIPKHPDCQVSQDMTYNFKKNLQVEHHSNERITIFVSCFIKTKCSNKLTEGSHFFLSFFCQMTKKKTKPTNKTQKTLSEDPFILH